MTVYEYRCRERLPIDKAAIAIGFFDGVHLAHRELILSAKAAAKKLGALSGVVTFASESSIKSGAPRIYTTEERLSIIESLGVDFAVICDFSEISGLSGEEFVRDVLIRDIGTVSVTAGFNFKFGHSASSNADSLVEYMEKYGGKAIIKEPYLYNDIPLSSTLIRGLLADGNPKEAHRVLGTPYFVSGVISHGNGIGRGLGFPTVNIAEDARRVKLKQGVYRCIALVGDKIYNAVTNVGTCPTFDERESHIEAHLIDFSENVYGEKIRIYFLGYLREEIRFDSPEELKKQIIIDKNRTLKENGEAYGRKLD